MGGPMYDPLPQQTGAIRLLRLLADPDEDAAIRCSLFTYILHDLGERPHLYEALSYVWGDSNSTAAIDVSGRTVNVTTNLYIALRHLRDRQLDRVLWVDALCIDQANHEEVAIQILAMSQIYGQATQVLVWLGEAAEDSDTVMETLRSATSATNVTRRHLRNIRAIQCLLQRPWFRRMWVLQEAAAARHVRILCGSKSLDGHIFCEGLQLSDPVTFELPPAVFLLQQAIFRPPFMTKVNMRAVLNQYRLGTLLDLYHGYEATKLHDKVYALLGLSTDDYEGSNLTPDYAVPWNQLFAEVIRHILGVSSQVHTWNEREIAMVNARGYVLGEVTAVETVRYGAKEYYDIVFKKRRDIRHRITCEVSAKPVQEGDFVCSFEGATGLSVIRLRKDYFVIIVIAAGSSRPHDPMLLVAPQILSRLTLLWDWETSRLEEDSKDRLHAPGSFKEYLVQRELELTPSILEGSEQRLGRSQRCFRSWDSTEQTIQKSRKGF